MRRALVVGLFGGPLAVAVVLAGAASPAAASPARAPGAPGKATTPAPEKTVNDILRGRAQLGVGDAGEAVRDVQARLNLVGIPTEATGTYTKTTAKDVEHFQEKFFLRQTGKVNDTTYRKLRELTRHGAGIPRSCHTKGKVLCVDKTDKVLRLMIGGEQRYVVDTRFGMTSTPTREGTFRVFRKVRHDYSSAFNSPMPWSMYFSGGQAIHGSIYFQADGYNGASHGCINVRDFKTLDKIYNASPLGTKVVIYRS